MSEKGAFVSTSSGSTTQSGTIKQGHIEGGYILLARKLGDSGIIEKPPLYCKLWIWMLLQASFKNHGDLKRGQFFTSLESMRDAMKYRIGYRTSKPSIKEIRDALSFFTHESPYEGPMAVSMKVTHGMVITICNYSYYQDISNYEGHNEGTTKVHTLGTIPRKKGIKKGNPPAVASEIFEMKKRYPDQAIIDQVFSAISTTRKTGRIAESVILGILHQWARFPVDQVITGIRTYLEKGYHRQGKDEKYLLGIIRNSNGHSTPEGTPNVDDFITSEDIKRRLEEI